MEITSGNVIEIELAGARIEIPANTIAELWPERLRGGEGVAAAPPPIPPRIGSSWLDGIYMGVVRGENGERDHHLIDLGEADERMPWEDAKKWAEKKGGSLPTRREQAVMFGNRAEDQYKEDWYWSSAQYAGGDDYAWMQDFDDGRQCYGHKSGDCRARAVRRSI